MMRFSWHFLQFFSVFLLFFSVRTSEEKRRSEEDDARIIRDVFFGLLSRLNSLFFRYFAASRPQWPVQFFLFVACKLRRCYDNSCVCCALALSAIEHLYIYAALHTKMMMGARIFLTFFLSVFLWCSAYFFFFSVRITAKEIPVSSDFCLLALFSHSEERRGILTLLDT